MRPVVTVVERKDSVPLILGRSLPMPAASRGARQSIRRKPPFFSSRFCNSINLTNIRPGMSITSPSAFS